jgi:drug/metabolite transporter superfamily protein YnfA
VDRGGVVALGLYGFVAGSLAWGMVADGYRPDRFDVIGALLCLAGVAVIHVRAPHLTTRERC